MDVTLLSFSKRLNSTKQPTAAELEAGKKYEGLTLKDLTNIDNPKLKLAGATLNEYAYNYAYIHDWGRYYHIKSCDLRHQDIYHADLELDDLATFKAQILGTSAYIVYSASNYNRWMRDDRTPIVARPPEVLKTKSTPMKGEYTVFEADTVNPTVILTTVSQNEGLTYWEISARTLDNILDGLTRAGGTVWGALQQQFGDAMGSMINALRLPVNGMVIPSTTVETMYLGSYEAVDGTGTPIEAFNINNDNKYVLFRGRCGIPTGYLDYRVFEPYSRLKIRLPFVGLCDISHQDFAGSVYYEVLIDLLNGKIVWTLYNDEDYNKAISTYSGQCGAYLPLAATQIQNASRLIESVASSGVSLGAAAVNPAIGLPASVITAASAFSHIMDKSTNVMGSYSGGITEIINTDVEIILEKFQTAVEPDNLTPFEGRPLGIVDTLTNYTGYIKTQGFSIDINANSDVIRSINRKLDAGIYIE